MNTTTSQLHGVLKLVNDICSDPHICNSLIQSLRYRTTQRHRYNGWTISVGGRLRNPVHARNAISESVIGHRCNSCKTNMSLIDPLPSSPSTLTATRLTCLATPKCLLPIVPLDEDWMNNPTKCMRKHFLTRNEFHVHCHRHHYQEIWTRAITGGRKVDDIRVAAKSRTPGCTLFELRLHISVISYYATKGI